MEAVVRIAGRLALVCATATLFVRARLLWRANRGREGRRVVLVGAGPGASDLISVRGLKLLRSAQVVVHDRLVSKELLAEVKPSARLINVGKAPSKKRLKQDDINEILVELATGKYGEFQVESNALIVRLKGGDPFVFGLGGDEVMALARAGIKSEIVPGITSAIAVPGCCGIPVTQKGIATSFTVLGGHIAPGEPGAADWDNLPKRDSTLVVLMGAKTLPKIAAFLVDKGWDEKTRIAVIESGTTASQAVIISDLGDVASQNRQFTSPSTVVIGQVCSCLSRDYLINDYKGHSETVATWGIARNPVSR